MSNKPNYLIEFYLDNNLIYSGNNIELLKTQPDWDGKLGLGDKITVDNSQRTIIEVEQKFPDSDRELVLMKIKLK